MEASAQGILMIIGTVSGYAGGLLLGIFLSRKTLQHLSKERLTYVAGLSACYISLIPAVFIATIVGGTVGGGFGEFALGTLGIPFGLSLGLIATTTFVVLFSSIVGFALGKGLHEILAKCKAT